MSFSLLFLMLATEKMKRYLYVSTHFRSYGTIHGALESRGSRGRAVILWPQRGRGCSKASDSRGCLELSLTDSPTPTFKTKYEGWEKIIITKKQALTSSIKFCFSSKPFLAVLVRETNTEKKKGR